MAFDKSTFRIQFPEFTDPVKYTDGMIDFWAGVAAKLTDATTWGNLYEQGLSLFVAHNLVLQAGNISAASGGGLPGTTAGSIASKAVGSANVSYDSASSMEPSAGHWNMTTYGRQYIHIARMIGVGGMHI
jgi:hypothetical protein